MLLTASVLLAVMGITLGIISVRHEELVMQQTKIQAKALFQQIVITRRWIADHGGVFVEKLPWVRENPFLRTPSLVEIDAGARSVKRSGRDVEFTRKEFDALPSGLKQGRSPQQGIDKEKALERFQTLFMEQAIDVHIQHLRHKIVKDPAEPQLILTVPGIGYRFRQ